MVVFDNIPITDWIVAFCAIIATFCAVIGASSAIMKWAAPAIGLFSSAYKLVPYLFPVTNEDYILRKDCYHPVKQEKVSCLLYAAPLQLPEKDLAKLPDDWREKLTNLPDDLKNEKLLHLVVTGMKSGRLYHHDSCDDSNHARCIYKHMLENDALRDEWLEEHSKPLNERTGDWYFDVLIGKRHKREFAYCMKTR